MRDIAHEPTGVRVLCSLSHNAECVCVWGGGGKTVLIRLKMCIRTCCMYSIMMVYTKLSTQSNYATDAKQTKLIKVQKFFCSIFTISEVQNT